MARTLAEVEEEYTAARTAYLAALSKPLDSYSMAGRSSQRRRLQELKDQVDALAKEMEQLGGGSRTAIPVKGVTGSYAR